METLWAALVAVVVSEAAAADTEVAKTDSTRTAAAMDPRSPLMEPQSAAEVAAVLVGRVVLSLMQETKLN